MMKPTPTELLQGVADALADTVLPTLERGPSRNQVQAAVGIVQRCASAVDRYGPILHADCGDTLATMRSVVGADPSLAPSEPASRRAFEAALDKTESVLDLGYPSVTELRDAAMALHEQLALIVVAAERQRSPVLPTIRDLLDRILAREEELGLSPW